MSDVVDLSKVDTSSWLPEGEFPTQGRCNPNCPEEAFLWMYSGLPGMNGAPLPFPIEYLRMVSRRQWDCGARPPGAVIPPEQKVKYQRPQNTDPHWLTSPGVWVDVNDPEREHFDIKEFVQSLPQDAKRQLAENLGFDPVAAVPSDDDIVEGYSTPRYGRPSSDGASVSNDPLPFDPVLRTVTEVVAYLRDADPEERERVLVIEKNLGNARRGILKRFPEAADL